MPILTGLRIAADPAGWHAIGLEPFDPAAPGRIRVGATVIDLVGVDAGSGILGWAIEGLSAPRDDLDGVPTSPGAPPTGPAPRHPLGATVVDHVVMRTPDLSRTLDSLEVAGLSLRRVREVPGSTMRQAFYRLGEVVLEVVGDSIDAGPGPSSLWGLVLTVDDETAAAARCGDRLGTFRDAVQPGRRIATFRREAGLGTAVAVITADPPRSSSGPAAAGPNP